MGLKITDKIPTSRVYSDKVLSEASKLAGIIAQNVIKEIFGIEGAT
jgi:ribosomal protein S25